MGEVAEMMLDGTMCCRCGVYLGSDTGVPTLCPSCSGERRKTKMAVKQAPAPKYPRVKCPLCSRMVKKGQGEKDHLMVVHGRQS